MNIQTKPPHTAAEEALFDGFARTMGGLPGRSAMVEARESAIEMIRRNGLPTRRIESWHYTDLRVLLRSVPPHDPLARPQARPALVQGSTVLALLNGHVQPVPKAEGMTAESVADGLAEGELGRAFAPQGFDDGIGAINTAFVTDGYRLTLARDARFAEPIELQNIVAGGQAHTRSLVTIEPGVKATVLQRFLGDDEKPALTTSITDLTVGEGAEIVWLVLQRQGEQDSHLSQINLTLAADAKLTLYVVNAGGKLAREEVRAKVLGEGAAFNLRGVNLLSGDSHADVTMSLDHAVPHTTSTEIMRNVVTGRARGVFQGQIRVAPNAQETDARMASNTLLLSDEGEFSTKPELEIFADDVQCGHGATVADIDENHLFYMTTRGIPERVARGLLIRGFVAEILEELADERLIEALEPKLAEWLEAHA